MTVVEVLVADKNVVEYRFSPFEVFAEEIGVETHVDIAQQRLKVSTSGPSQINAVHIAFLPWDAAQYTTATSPLRSVCPSSVSTCTR